MSFWDKLKSAKNYITGGGAELSLNIEESYLREPFKVTLDIQIKDLDIEADRIYLVFRNIEEVDLEVKLNHRNTNPTNDPHSRPGSHFNDHQNVRKEHILIQEEITLDKSVLLSANENYYYEQEIHLPVEGVPTFGGKYAKIYWCMQAFIEKSGNDPNSQLIVFDPIYTIS